MSLIKSYVLNFTNVKFIMSEKKETIFDDRDNVIGYMNRFYKTPFQKIFSYTGLPDMFSNIYVEDKNGKEKVKIEVDPKFFDWIKCDQEWDITLQESDNERKVIKLKQKHTTFVKKRFKLEKDNKKIIIIDQTSCMEPKFYDENDKLIAKCQDKFASREVCVSIFSEEIDIFFVSAICHLIYILNT